MLAASIEAGALNAPVRIRNLSETGAAIEGPALPHIGASFTLRRLDVSIAGVVMWVTGGRCGVHFDGKICVTDWISGSRAPLSATRDQTRVDTIQAAIRTGSGFIPQAPVHQTTEVQADLDARLSQELAFVRRLLEQLGEELSDEPAVLARHMRALQSFDLAGQILGHIATILIAEDRSAAVNAIGMEDLRGRLLRKPVAQ
ncbi:hypothetical protein C7I55_16710 [Sphingomonas deserti]|uniref:PilZ domain-containing protein n=2 Tax=Allosphingosinicella deserti TaxID=2116704 RepID=A0A2P7QME1_9SPHN|nr:hypothetical protein C7I55_16710 [Sphingomonas deserti]